MVSFSVIIWNLSCLKGILSTISPKLLVGKRVIFLLFCDWYTIQDMSLWHSNPYLHLKRCLLRIQMHISTVIFFVSDIKESIVACYEVFALTSLESYVWYHLSAIDHNWIYSFELKVKWKTIAQFHKHNQMEVTWPQLFFNMNVQLYTDMCMYLIFQTTNAQLGLVRCGLYKQLCVSFQLNSYSWYLNQSFHFEWWTIPMAWPIYTYIVVLMPDTSVMSTLYNVHYNWRGEKKFWHLKGEESHFSWRFYPTHLTYQLHLW